MDKAVNKGINSVDRLWIELWIRPGYQQGNFFPQFYQHLINMVIHNVINIKFPLVAGTFGTCPQICEPSTTTTIKINLIVVVAERRRNG